MWVLERTAPSAHKLNLAGPGSKIGTLPARIARPARAHHRTVRCRSLQHEHRQVGVLEERAGDAADYPLAQRAVPSARAASAVSFQPTTMVPATLCGTSSLAMTIGRPPRASS
jgi:hypothetical protein